MQDADFDSGNPSLESALADLAGRMALEGNGETSAISIEMPQSSLDRALNFIERAKQENLAGNRDGAWFFYSEARALAHYHEGMTAGRFTSPSTQGLREFLVENGAKGGTRKGVNAREIHDGIVKEILDLSAKKTWRTLADFEKEIREVARKVQGKADALLSDRRLKAILKEKEIAKINHWIKAPRPRRRPSE